MKLRVVISRDETCVQMYNGPIVLPDGTVMACSCVAAIDAMSNLGIGNILESSLLDIWTNERIRKLRLRFKNGSLNKTGSGCDMYRSPELYRTSERRVHARVNRLRSQGTIAKRKTEAEGYFSGG